MMKTSVFAVVAAVLSLSTAACSGGGGGGGGNDDDGPGSLMGRVRDVVGNDISAATVIVAGTAVEVNEQGWFFATEIPAAERVEVMVAATGYVSTQRFVEVVGDRNTFVDVRLFTRAPPVSVNNATGATVPAGSGGLTIPATAIRLPNGTMYSGSANVSVSLLDPSDREQRLGVPGGFFGVDDTNTTVDFESFGMLNVEIDDGAGGTLVLGSGAALEFTLPVASGGTPPATMPLWNYDMTAGTWVEVGTATYNAANGTYTASGTQVGVTFNFGSGGNPAPSSYWNADQPYATACLEGRVVNPEGEPAVGAIEVTSEGVDYVGSSTTFTDNDGRFTVNVKANASAQVYAQGGGLYTDVPVVVNPTPSELATEGCTDIGDVILAYPIASIVLTWGATPSDLDSHFTGPDATIADTRFHVYYSGSSPQATLDTDDTSGFGPEVISLLQAEPGTYVYSIHNYSGEASGPIRDSGAIIRAFVPGGFREFAVADADGDVADGNGVWRVFKFTISGNGNIGGIDAINEIVPYTDDTVYDP